MKILIIEDDQRLAENTKLFLEKLDYQVDAVNTGGTGLLRAKQFDYAVILLDWMLPDMEGITILKELRRQQINTPVIITTAKSQLEDKLEGFSEGTDDYMTKPYTLTELSARIAAVIRRVYAEKNSNTLEIGKLHISLDTAQVNFADNQISLTPKEFAILELLALNKDKIVSRPEILHQVWNDDVDQFTNHVEVHIKNLRAKLGKGQKLIKTVKGKGYILTESL
ncbi:DNA-binding response regulator [Candidatus Dojkabacteria bacterium CG_4_9_14_3_um_filter_150_Dojkabacteria_WS6_41_13]|uniref:DNA-binding response regulator n=1 Tax=Candidatus Dojkabacteria bacterium CG_4_10_14_0_2_um_filter_Dojkabacteria_WS6_41_15 TaxID=2014249 RepID=A0A2M7W2F7_9BACT|nr:MAG: DNA-binding response regulator [Candidatus Dojkabacteria bacterium CG_4_10_14_3_um_filter_Dojkabacteria_WS6_41_9]PJA14774.1 MAG: DNA-binding response regulator [Candidatus Dojkabacteria bacterium CG_4_10_14_0_2_um_filter_Dojkabacteria_WS6_41_15]PJB22498.1 MAG: DNA-binding response regulator [Candidatus Dojkabacteria bacterium CG_4_9_14_3_um_filter_150_Dojkabacteria_WS6_41_13]